MAGPIERGRDAAVRTRCCSSARPPPANVQRRAAAWRHGLAPAAHGVVRERVRRPGAAHHRGRRSGGDVGDDGGDHETRRARDGLLAGRHGPAGRAARPRSRTGATRSARTSVRCAGSSGGPSGATGCYGIARLADRRDRAPACPLWTPAQPCSCCGARGRSAAPTRTTLLDARTDRRDAHRRRARQHAVWLRRGAYRAAPAMARQRRGRWRNAIDASGARQCNHQRPVGRAPMVCCMLSAAWIRHAACMIRWPRLTARMTTRG